MLNITIVLVEHPITWSLKLMYCLLFLVWMPIVGQTWGRWWWPRWWGPQTARRRRPPGGAPNFFPKEVCIFVTSLQHCFLQLIAISCNFLITMGWGCQTWGHWRWPWSRGAKTARRGGAPNFLRRKGACFLYIHSIYSITEVLQLGKKIQVLCSAYIDRRFFVVDRRFLM